MADIKDLTVKLKAKEFSCPYCKFVFEKATRIMGNSNQMKRGKIMICAQCAHPSILGDSHLRPIARDEFLSFPKSTQMAIASAATNVKKRISDSGETWSPFHLPSSGN